MSGVRYATNVKWLLIFMVMVSLRHGRLKDPATLLVSQVSFPFRQASYCGSQRISGSALEDVVDYRYFQSPSPVALFDLPRSFG